ncbi:MAG: hypothetical protein D6701_02775 [Gemmatimonadetes bacterium]|nr:MAG: hypothetical protein D6701_02775 [Gemmatimonadota bacterium]
MVDESLAVPGVVEEGRLLTLTTEEAVAVGYADVVEDLPDLLERVDLAGVEVRDLEVNWAERIVRFLSHPTVAPFLLSIGFLGLLVEIKTPTFGLSGALGVLALSLFFGSHLILGLAGWEDLLLFGLGLVLLAAEVFVVPGFGLLGILGISGILAGLYLSLLGSFPTMTDIATAGGVLSTTLLLILLAGWALLKYLPRSGRLHRSGVFLDAATARETGYESARARKDLVGREGRAITDLRPSGVGLFGDERVDIVSEAEWIEEGTPVRIISAEGYRHVVRPIERVALDAGDGGRAAAAKSRTGEPPAPTAAADTDTDTDAPAAERPASGESELPPSEDDDR